MACSLVCSTRGCINASLGDLSHGGDYGTVSEAAGLEPLWSVTYQREVFLDNSGTFWLLLSLYLIIVSKSRLSHIVQAFAHLAASVQIL
jgi:hypothetical protein